MQVFKSALRVFFRHPVYLVIYVLWLGCMGLFMGMSFASTGQGAFSEERPTVAVIDRDGSALSQGVADFLENHSQMVVIDDSERAMQDATAQDQAAYIVIIPQGFGRAFEDAVESGGDAPTLDTVVSYESYAGPMMDNLVNEYLATVRTYVVSGVGGDQARIAARASADLENAADAALWQADGSTSVAYQYSTYMNFSVYPAMLAIIICVAVVMSAFSRGEVRRRDSAAGTSSLSMNLQIGLACAAIALIVWMWISALGLAVFGGSLAGASSTSIASGLASLFVFCLVALALGFLIGQLTSSELVMNAAGNIVGLILSFLGGTWISLDLVGEPVATVAKLTPTYYYGDALAQAYGNGGIAGSTTSFASDLAIMALFAAAIFAVALAVGRQKTRGIGNSEPARVGAPA